MTEKTTRAKPMSVEDRRESILDAALPLVRERGIEVTTREIADAAGVAEGTVFRAFVDKQELIAAVVMREMDPEATHRRLRALDENLSLEDAVADIVVILQDRFTSLASLLANLGKFEGPRGGHEHPHPGASGAEVTSSILERYTDQLRMSPTAAAHVIRVLVFGVSMPVFGQQSLLTSDDIVDFVLRGILKEGL